MREGGREGRRRDDLRAVMMVIGKGKGGMEKHTFAILARRKERMRNLNLSSSVCVMMRLKFADGSMVPVMSSTVSICVLRRRFD